MPKCGLIAGRIELFFRNLQNLTAIELLELCIAFNQEEYIEVKHYGATANLFAFKNIFEKIGYFNGKLLSSGDCEWGRRVFAAGFKQLYADDVIVRHPARRTFRERFKKIIRIVKGLVYLNFIHFKFKRFILECMPQFRILKKIVCSHEYNEVVKGPKDKFKLIIAVMFEYYARNIVKTIILIKKYFSHSKDSK